MSQKQSKNRKTPQRVTSKNKTKENWFRFAPYVVIGIIALIYVRALGNGIVYLDDYYYISTNQYLRNFSWEGIRDIFSTFYSGNYHPLTTLSNLLEFHFYGENPFPYHFINVLLHLANTWLAMVLTEKLSGKKMTALVVGALFGLHPMHVESVAWISERKDVLYSFFYLFSLIWYLRYIENGFRKTDYFILFFLFLLSLLSKSVAVTLPIAAVAIDVYKGRKISAKVFIEKAPLLIFSFLFGIIALLSQSSANAIMSLGQAFGPGNRVFLFFTGLSAYLLKIVLPWNLTAIHYYPTIPGGGIPWYYYLSLPFIVVLGWLVYLSRKRPYFKDVMFGIAFFLIIISVMLQVISVGTAMYSERYSYISSIGLFYIVGQAVSGIFGESTKRIAKISVGLFLIACCYLTYQQIGIWKNSIDLFSDIIEKNEGNANVCFAYNIRGNVKKAEGNLKEAIEDYDSALRLYPKFESAYWNRAHAFDDLGNFEAALANFDESIKLNPQIPDSYNDRGWVYFEIGNIKAALTDFNRAIAIEPKFSPAYNNRGWLHYKNNDNNAALSDFEMAIKFNPDYLKPYYNVAILKTTSGDINGAIAAYNEIIKTHPNENIAFYSRGYIYFTMKDLNKACEDWKKSAELGNEQASNMLKQYCK